MWNLCPIYLLCVISVCRITAYDIRRIMPDFDVSKTFQFRNVSNVDVLNLISRARRLLQPTVKERDALRAAHNIKLTETNFGKEMSDREENIAPSYRRSKRQVGKFSDAARVDNLKSFRIVLTMFRNLWSKSYVGGSHPLHPNVPKPVIILFKQRIMEFFFPPIGDEAKKN